MDKARLPSSDPDCWNCHSRIPDLISELLLVILSVIIPSRPLSNLLAQHNPSPKAPATSPSNTPNPSSFPIAVPSSHQRSPPCAESSSSSHSLNSLRSHITSLRRVLDVPYLTQLLHHSTLDPSQLNSIFSLIGSILMCHCAPMRDRSINDMIAMTVSDEMYLDGAQHGFQRRARVEQTIRVFRRCFEIVELMRLVCSS